MTEIKFEYPYTDLDNIHQVTKIKGKLDNMLHIHQKNNPGTTFESNLEIRGSLITIRIKIY